MTTTSISLRQRLRAETSALHAALEQRIGPLERHNEYNKYVRGLHHFRAGAEAWLTSIGETCAEAWRGQRLEPYLRQDMHDLGVPALDASPPSWRGVSASFALGVHYVLEGSALGARILCKQVAALGLHRDHGARHLWAQAEAGHWRTFLDHLERFEGDRAGAVAGANAAFAAAAASMERAAHG